MATRKEKLFAQAFRKATFDELCGVLAKVEGVPEGAVDDLATVVWMCVPLPPELRDLWTKAAEATKALRDWLVEHEHNPKSVELIVELLEEYGFDEYRIWEGSSSSPMGPVISADMSHKEKPGYPTLLKLGVDILRECGLELGAALETMARVLYWVWRDPDERAGDKQRRVETLGRRYRDAVRWAEEREKQGQRLLTIAELATYRMAEILGKHGVSYDVVPGATANARHYVWIPDRGAA